jgi:hypothetical protein
MAGSYTLTNAQMAANPNVIGQVNKNVLRAVGQIAAEQARSGGGTYGELAPTSGGFMDKAKAWVMQNKLLAGGLAGLVLVGGYMVLRKKGKR